MIVRRPLKAAARPGIGASSGKLDAQPPLLPTRNAAGAHNTDSELYLT
jgi:hypothetical protein